MENDTKLREMIKMIPPARSLKEDIDKSIHLAGGIILIIVRNLCYDELRRNGRFQYAPLVEETFEPNFYSARAGPQPDELTHLVLLSARIQGAIDKLPELQRQTLILYYEEDLSYEQIATTMSVDVATVRTRVFYARKNLKRILGPRMLKELGIT